MGKILARGHSRVPVYDGNPRNIIGLLLVSISSAELFDRNIRNMTAFHNVCFWGLVVCDMGMTF